MVQLNVSHPGWWDHSHPTSGNPYTRGLRCLTLSPCLSVVQYCELRARHLHFELNFGCLLCLFNLLEGQKCSDCDNTIESHNVLSLEHVGIHQIIIIYFLYLYIYETGHFPSIHHRGTVCLQMFDARPYGRVKRLKISDIKISHQPSRIFPSLSDFSRLLAIFIQVNSPVGPG